jgi:sterol desaturase/sphingolipid hydroxylase (fatty acid hydroxylase superfamily)
VVAWFLLYVVYDFFYTIFHGVLHIPVVYGAIHKHHHKQMAPSRGYLDASNVHPFEFVCGEYNHLLAIFIVSAITGAHAYAVIAFIILDGIWAPLNHTRYDVALRMRLPFDLWAVRNHDLHHRLPRKNMGQYIMLWDFIFGTYQEYTPFKGTPIPLSEVKKARGKKL